ncbi:hypothetical protein ABTN67_20885, partial [Acinetobacter baumannii]
YATALFLAGFPGGQQRVCAAALPQINPASNVKYALWESAPFLPSLVGKDCVTRIAVGCGKETTTLWQGNCLP